VLSNRRVLPNIESMLAKYPVEPLRHACYPTPEHFTEPLSAARWAHALRTRAEARFPRPLALFVQFPPSGDDAAVEVLLQALAQLEGLLARREAVALLHIAGAVPSAPDANALAQLLSRIEVGCAVSHEAARTIELGAVQATPQALSTLVDLGFNRLVVCARGRVRAAASEENAALQRAVDAARAAGLRSIGIDLLYGAPGQTSQDIAEAVGRVTALRPEHVNLSAFGARLSARRVARAASTDAGVATLAEAIGGLLEAGYVYAGLDVFVRAGDAAAGSDAILPDAAQRCGLGYPLPSRFDILGLGPAAISSVGELYAQNEPAREAYFERVAAGQPPIRRGLQLSADDMLRREIIHALEYRFSVAFSALEHKYGIEFGRYFAAELGELARMDDDGLIELYEDAIEVPDSGRALVRVAAAVFDRHCAGRRQLARSA
jgi:oxygen-independent coproporphyrinogen-3 oxidase